MSFSIAGRHCEGWLSQHGATQASPFHAAPPLRDGGAEGEAQERAGGQHGATQASPFHAAPPPPLRGALQKNLPMREWPHTLPGGPVSEEMRSLLLQHARSSRDGSHFLQPVFVYMTTCNQQD